MVRSDSLSRLGDRMSSKLIKIRNLLVENDLCLLFEFTFLRQLVANVREVTGLRARNPSFGRVPHSRAFPLRRGEKPHPSKPAWVESEIANLGVG